MRKSQLRIGTDGNLYYLKDDGAMAVSETIVDKDSGKTYGTDENGVCREVSSIVNNSLTIPIVTKYLPSNYQHGQQVVKMLVLHDTGNTEGDSAAANYTYFSTNAAPLNSGVTAHAFIDDKELIRTVPDSQQAWHVKGSYNGKAFNEESYGMELCNLLTQAKVTEQVDNAAKYFAMLCTDFNLDPMKDIYSHGELTKLGNVSGGHMDPHTYLAKWGHDMDAFRKSVSGYM